jgi:hypothetical protein
MQHLAEFESDVVDEPENRSRTKIGSPVPTDIRSPGNCAQATGQAF